MRCPRCEHGVTAGDTTCGQCGQSLGGSEAAAALPGQRPAHLAVLEGSAPEAEPPKPKPRLVSRAGPAVPVTSSRPNDDAVPSSGAAGWMARLEQAKRASGGDAKTPAPGTPTASAGAASGAAASGSTASGRPAAPPGLPTTNGGPPPLPPPLPKKAAEPAPAPPARNSFAAKPAHLLVAELEAAEREKKEAKARVTAFQSADDEISKSEIANVEIPKPDTEVAERHVPKWVYGVAAVLVIGGIAGAWWYAEEKTPVVVAQADPELLAKHEKMRSANAAVEEGHALLGDQKDPAKIDLAIVAYKKALAIDPAFARAERALGVAYAAKGDDAEAAEHYKRFLTLDPGAPEATQVKAILAKYEAKAKK